MGRRRTTGKADGHSEAVGSFVLGGYGEVRVRNPLHPERVMRKIAVLPDGQRDGIMDIAEKTFSKKPRTIRKKTSEADAQ